MAKSDEKYNHTQYTDEEIAAMPLLCTVRCNWRKRTIQLRECGEMILSDGRADTGMRVICLEWRVQWARALDTGRAFVTFD